MNKKTKKYIGAAVGVLGVAGALAVASEFFFALGFVNRKGRNPSPDMSVWDPEAEQKTASAAVRNMKQRRYRHVMDPESVKRREYANRKKDEGRAWILSKDPERWNITSDDGIPLVAHYIPAENAKAVFILVHGYRSNGLRDFAYIAKPLYEKGYSLLILDNRAHGESGGKYISYGALERFDVILWANEVKRRLPELPVILNGVSMGAATVLMAASLDLPDNVRGVVADSGYTSPSDIFKSVIKRMYHLPEFPFVPLARVMSRRRIGVDFADVSAAESVKKTKVPLLFAHGTGDTFVPHDMSEKNFANAPTGMARMILVDGAEHTQSYLFDPKRYGAELDRFLEGCLK